jgi:hypothetical protein
MPAERQPAGLDPRPRDPEPTPVPAPSAPGKDLTLNKVLACAGAAATSALVGSLFGVEGTVLGAAVGSAVSTVATTIYQRSLDRTRETVRARIKLPGGRAVEVAAPLDVPAPRVSPEGETGLARVHVTPAPRRRDWTARAVPVLLVTALVFGLGMLLITGVELLTGSPVSGGQPGTSIGHVLGGDHPAATHHGGTTHTTPPHTSAATHDSPTPTTSWELTPSASEQPSATASDEGRPDDEDGPDRGTARTEATRTEVSPTPSPGWLIRIE